MNELIDMLFFGLMVSGIVSVIGFGIVVAALKYQNYKDKKMEDEEEDKSNFDMMWYLLNSNSTLSWTEIIGLWMFNPAELLHCYNQEMYFSGNMESRWSK